MTTGASSQTDGLRLRRIREAYVSGRTRAFGHRPGGLRTNRGAWRRWRVDSRRASGEAVRARELEALNTNARGIPLYGLPFAVKDNIDVEGVPTTAACPDLPIRPRKAPPAWGFCSTPERSSSERRIWISSLWVSRARARRMAWLEIRFIRPIFQAARVQARPWPSRQAW